MHDDVFSEIEFTLKYLTKPCTRIHISSFFIMQYSRSIITLRRALQKEQRTIPMLLVASNQPNLTILGARLVSVCAGRIAFGGVKLFTGSTGRYRLHNVRVGNNDTIEDRGDDSLNTTITASRILRRSVVLDHGSSHNSKEMRGTFQWEHDQYGEEVEAIMDGGSGKGTFEFISVAHLTDGYNGVGYRPVQ